MKTSNRSGCIAAVARVSRILSRSRVGRRSGGSGPAWLTVLLSGLCVIGLGLQGAGSRVYAQDALGQELARRPLDELVVPLRAESGGIWVDVKINDRVTHRMLLDTGASVMVLPASLARDIGLRSGGVERELRTIQGNVKGRLVTLDEVTIGTAKVEGVAAVVLEGEEQPVGLLGRSFLNNFAFSVDLDKNVMTLKPRRTAQSVPWREVTPAQHIDRQLEVLRAEVDRAARDPNSTSAYRTRLQDSVAYWERRRANYD